ncbi:hypothetical protein FSB78_17215 [Sphingomonas ginsenosidivorax]|uniref:Uncharacterized protein n=1 Tax=Sphingomonas ginsenosidivorax TaxID=862135 RepID=A0A5C6UMA0_9SPHN|nr:hypothetical protein [Sphingomonas ginsenosidivorax]TXC72495.1 hypothetical protein FSB78_17215 [Sphingomonas ginsenosidivorax]
MTDRPEPPRAAFATVPGDDYGMTYYDVPLPDDAAGASGSGFKTFVPGGDPLDDGPHVSRRQDGWSAANQRSFLEGLAEGHGVDAAARRVGLSAASAYAFRRTAKGAAFALGWRAATLVARDSIAETLLVRALEGTVDTIVRGETVITRHKYDNRLALSLLARLDRQAESAPDADAKAACLVAQEFDAYLNLVGQDAGPARAGLFLARRCAVLGGDGQGVDGAGQGGGMRGGGPDLYPIYALAAADRFLRTGVATAAEVDIADLDPAARSGWTAEQWARAEAAGLVAIAAPAATDDDIAAASQQSQHSPDDDDDDDEDGEDVTMWQCAKTDEWRTNFPPPADFLGFEQGDFGTEDYQRELDAYEQGCMDDAAAFELAQRRRAEGEARDRYFAAIRTAIYGADLGVEREGQGGDSAEQAPAETVEPTKQPGSADDQDAPPA